jgi:hypothetical protein
MSPNAINSAVSVPPATGDATSPVTESGTPAKSAGTIPSNVLESLQKAGDRLEQWVDKKVCGENGREAGSKEGEAESGPEISIGIGSGEELKRKTSFKTTLGEDGKPQPGWLCSMLHSRSSSFSYGPVTIKKDEYDVKLGPASFGVEKGDPKLGLEVGVEPMEGVEVKAEVEAKAKLLANDNPYSAGDLEIEGSAGVKAHKVEIGVKQMLHKAEIFFGMGASEGIKENRENLSEAAENVQVKNIKQELQEDPDFKPAVKNHDLGAILREGKEEFGKLWDNIGNASLYDQQGRLIDPKSNGQ